MKHTRSRREKCEWMNTTKLIMNEIVKKNERNNSLSPSPCINDSSLIYFIHFLKTSHIFPFFVIDTRLRNRLRFSWPEVVVKFHEISMRNTFMLQMTSFQCVQLLLCIKSVAFVNCYMLRTSYWEFPFICVNLDV